MHGAGAESESEKYDSTHHSWKHCWFMRQGRVGGNFVLYSTDSVINLKFFPLNLKPKRKAKRKK